MGNYNADSNPDTSKGNYIMQCYKLFTTEKTKFDQWTVSGDIKVYKFTNKTRKDRLRLKVDASQISD